MIIAVIAVWSVCAVYITSFLQSRKMKAAAAAYVALFAYFIGWIFSVFFLDIAQFGFTESRWSMLYGSDIWRSFVMLTDAMKAVPSELLFAFIVLSIAFVVALFAYFIISGVRIYKELKKTGEEIRRRHMLNEYSNKSLPCKRTDRLYIMHCRLNT